MHTCTYVVLVINLELRRTRYIVGQHKACNTHSNQCINTSISFLSWLRSLGARLMVVLQQQYMGERCASDVATH